MLMRINISFIIRRILLNKYLLLTRRKLLKMKRLRCEYRVNVQSDYPYEWYDLAVVRLLFELLMTLKVREAEFNNRTGYYNPSDPKSDVKKYVPGSKRFSVLFGITTHQKFMCSFFANMYWAANYHFGNIKREISKEEIEWSQINLERLNKSPVFLKSKRRIETSTEKISSAVDDKTFIAISQNRRFKLLSLTDSNEGRERERAPLLALKEFGDNSCLVLHCFYFNFAPFLGYGSEEFKRHFGIEFEFYIKEHQAGKTSILYDIMVFLTSRKLNWVWIEEEFIERFEKNLKINSKSN